jgi:hypothetical protein
MAVGCAILIFTGCVTERAKQIDTKMLFKNSKIMDNYNV